MRWRTGGIGVALAAAWGAGWGAPAPAAAQDDARAGLVVDAAWLQEHLGRDEVVVLHVGGAFDEGHVPGAAPLPLSAISVSRGEGDDPALVRLDLPPDLDTVRRAFEAAGVSDGSTVVVVFEGRRLADATRVLWTLDVVGLGSAGRLLDGGLEAWKAAGGVLSTEASAPRAGRITTAPRLDRRVDREFVRTRGRDAGIALVDARRPGHWDGTNEEIEGRAGHIPGAGNLFFGDLVGDDGRLRPADELRGLLARAGVEEGDRVVAYCHIGLWASGVVFAARTLGYDAVLYDGSMTEWARDRALPLDPAPGGR